MYTKQECQDNAHFFLSELEALGDYAPGSLDHVAAKVLLEAARIWVWRSENYASYVRSERAKLTMRRTFALVAAENIMHRLVYGHRYHSDGTRLCEYLCADRVVKSGSTYTYERIF